MQKEKMADAVISVATEAVRPLLNSLATQLGYIWNYKTNFENLERQLHKLKDTLARVQHSVEEAESKVEKIEQKVVKWLNSAEKIIAEVTEIIDDNNGANMRCFKSLCPDLKKRYHIGKKAAFKAKEVSEVEKEGNSLGEVSYRTLSKEPWGQFLTDYEDFESRRSIVEDVLKALSNSDVYMVGVYGMGGAGKTTLARVVGKQAEEQKVFDVVVFVEVSETPNVRNIQKEIAGKLGLELQAESIESVIANKLYEQLQKGRKNILLILDNIWKGGLEYLKKVGIPFGGNRGACKLLLTARSIDVLKKDMNSPTNFAVDHLNEKDAWDLFKKVAAGCIEQHGLQLLASDVAKRCGGLPIAIVTIAKALKDKQEHAWKTALLELQRPSLENLELVTAEAYSCIRLSYNQLNSKELKSIFLLCCTMGFTSDHSIERLLRYGMGLNLLNTVCSMGEARNRVNTLIQDLKNFSLLLEAFDDERFSIHDVVRDVGRAIDHNNLMVNDDRILWDLAKKNTLKNCTSIILHDISRLPEELNCPQLKFLYVKPKTRFSKILDNFFKGMLNLGVLHLIEIVLSPLPTSFHLLKELQTLHLDRCHLGDIAEIGNTKNLEILVLGSDMERLPEEIGELTRLKVLDLSQCSNLEVIPPNTISRLTELEELYMPDDFCKWQGVEGERSNVSLGELEHLSQLRALQICIPDAKLVPKGLLFQNLQRYRLYIGVEKWRCYSGHKASRLLKLKYYDDNISVEDGIIKQLKEIEELKLIGKQGVKNVLYELNRDGFPKLKHFDVGRNPELVYIVDFPKQSEPCVAFPHLQTLSLEDLSSLEKICHGQFSSPNSFCQLRTIRVERCVKLKNIFSSSIARHLSQLERIRVSYCENIEEIFSIVGGENEEIVFEKLDSLTLLNLPKLRSFTYDEEEVGSTCDEERQMKDSLMPLFDGKVKFRNLKTISLSGINLKYVFSSSTLGSFVQLQSLYIDNCRVLEEIIRIDHDLKNNVELPSLEKLESLYLGNLPKLRSFSYEEEVGSTSDEERHMKDTLMPLFDGKVKFPNLKTMRLWEINLKYVFSSSTLGSFVQLQRLEIYNCTVLEEIIRIDHDLKNNVELPSLEKLDYLYLSNLPKLRSFTYDEEEVGSTCDEERQMKDSLMPLFDGKVKFRNLKTISLSGINLKYVFSSSTLGSFVQLQCLKIKNCSVLEEIIRIDHDLKNNVELPSLEKLESLDLRNLPKLRSFSYEEEVGSTSDEERQMKDTLMPLFDGKVKFRNLKTISLWEINLKYAFSSSTLESFVQLQSLEIDNCRVLEEIIRIDHDLKNNVELPSLKKLKLGKCPQMKSFIFSDKVTFPSLEEIEISDMDNLEMIWHNQFEDSQNVQNCQKLCKVSVSNCQSLKNLFPAPIVRNLWQLKDIYVGGCGIKEIIAKKEGAEEAGDKMFLFPELTSLSLHNLQELKCLYPGIHTTKWPMLKTLNVFGCDKIDASEFFNIQEVISEDLPDIVSQGKVLPNLEELGLDGRIIKMVWQRPFLEILFPKLKFLAIQNDESMVLSPNSLMRSHNLEGLLLKNSSYEWIFSCEEIEEYAQIKSLYVTGLGNLKQIWKQDSKVDTILQSLENLIVRSCGSLVTLLPPSTSFQNLTVLKVYDCRLINLISSSTAKSLMQLKKMKIEDCNMMTEVVTGDGAGIEDEINFKNLKSLKLISLSRLRRFCSGNYNFNFPSLEILEVKSCPKMWIFSSKATNTPMLREIKLDCESYYCDGDVNKTMERIHEKEVFSSDELALSANEIRMILQKFPEHKFSEVETLEVFDDESTVFPLDILQRFQNLNYLKLSYTSYKEIFSCEEVEKHAETLAQIKRLCLEKLDDLEQMWKQDSGSDLILHNLESLEVVECNNLITLVPTSASFQNLGSMEISGCNGLRSFVTATVAKSLVQLWRLLIRNCNEMTEIVAIGDVKEDEIIFNKLWTLELTDLSNLTSFYFGNYTLNFPSLTNLKVTRCPKMKFFSSGISSMPMLQQIEWGSSKYNLEGDLNTTIQRINEEMNVERSTKDCPGPSTQHLD